MVLTVKRRAARFLKRNAKHVTGIVRVKLFKGHAIVEGRKSEYSLYDEKLATYTKDDAFDHHAAIGFIELWGLPTKVNSIVKRRSRLKHEEALGRPISKTPENGSTSSARPYHLTKI